MKKIIHSKITLVFFLCLILNFSTSAQTHKYFIITGKIITDCAILKDATIQIVKNDKPLIKVQIPENGYFRLELDYNSDFNLTFSQNGYQSKIVKINTEIPDEVMAQSANLSHFLMAVRLIKDMADTANLLPDDEVQQIKFSPELNNFARITTDLDQDDIESEKTAQNQANHHSLESKSKQNYATF